MKKILNKQFALYLSLAGVAMTLNHVSYGAEDTAPIPASVPAPTAEHSEEATDFQLVSASDSIRSENQSELNQDMQDDFDEAMRRLQKSNPVDYEKYRSYPYLIKYTLESMKATCRGMVGEYTRLLEIGIHNAIIFSAPKSTLNVPERIQQISADVLNIVSDDEMKMIFSSDRLTQKLGLNQKVNLAPLSLVNYFAEDLLKILDQSIHQSLFEETRSDLAYAQNLFGDPNAAVISDFHRKSRAEQVADRYLDQFQNDVYKKFRDQIQSLKGIDLGEKDKNPIELSDDFKINLKNELILLSQSMLVSETAATPTTLPSIQPQSEGLSRRMLSWFYSNPESENGVTTSVAADAASPKEAIGIDWQAVLEADAYYLRSLALREEEGKHEVLFNLYRHNGEFESALTYQNWGLQTPWSLDLLGNIAWVGPKRRIRFFEDKYRTYTARAICSVKAIRQFCEDFSSTVFDILQEELENHVSEPTHLSAHHEVTSVAPVVQD